MPRVAAPKSVSKLARVSTWRVKCLWHPTRCLAGGCVAYAVRTIRDGCGLDLRRGCGTGPVVVSWRWCESRCLVGDGRRTALVADLLRVAPPCFCRPGPTNAFAIGPIARIVGSRHDSQMAASTGLYSDTSPS